MITIAETYTDAATAAGDDANFTFLEGANHFDIVDPCGPAWPIVAGAVFSLLNYEPPPGHVQNPGSKLCPLN